MMQQRWHEVRSQSAMSDATSSDASELGVGMMRKAGLCVTCLPKSRQQKPWQSQPTRGLQLICWHHAGKLFLEHQSSNVNYCGYLSPLKRLPLPLNRDSGCGDGSLEVIVGYVALLILHHSAQCLINCPRRSSFDSVEAVQQIPG